MLQALVITLREGVEAALIVGIVLSYLNKIGRPELRRSVYAALAAALVASVGLAVLLASGNFNPDKFEGWVMLAAAVFVVSMIAFMAKASKTLKGDIERKVGGLAGSGSRAGIFFFVFLMVVREGAETVLILAGVTFTTSEVMSFVGTLLGVGLSIIFGVMFVKGSIRIDLPRFFRITTVILIFVAIQLTISGLHELSETGIIPSSKRQMALIGPIVRNDIFFFVMILALAAMMMLFDSRRRQDAAAPASANRSERRKQQWTARREKLWTSAVYVSSFVFILLVTAQFIYARGASALSPAAEVQFVNGTVTLSTADMHVGELRRYSAAVGAKHVRFLLYKRPDGKVATVLDACAICGDVGFFASTQGVTCKNCNAPVNPQSLGEGGGCNPIPLVAKVSGDTVTISQLDLGSSAAQVKQ